MIIILEVNMITRQMNPFFLISSLSSIRCYILFLAFQDLKNSISWGPPFGLFLVWKYTIHAENYIFKPVTIDILFLYKIC